MATPPTPTLFPVLTPSYLLSFQFSSWYPKFSALSIKSTIIRPLSPDFIAYLDADDGIFVPEGSEDVPAESTLSDDDGDEEEEGESPERRRFAFPELDAQIRDAIKEYGAVFPKLNFSSPKDASWILPASSPLKCTSPSDVYLLLKSSDFISHDLSRPSVFAGCVDEGEGEVPYELELVLRKWYPVDRSRELRCFVRCDRLLAISQRDTNYYEFYNEPATQSEIVSTVQEFWETNIRRTITHPDYTFDLLLTRSLSRAHILDFNPYAPRTDALLFTYPELLSLALAHSAPSLPQLRAIPSRAHPAAARNAPLHQHNMVPLEALTLGGGRDVGEFGEVLEEEIRRSMREGE